MAKDKRYGNYRLDRLIGHGVMGAVYRAEDESTNQTVAVKVLPATVATNEEYTRRFLTEARVAQRLDHPNIIRVRDYGRDNGHYYLAMEYVDGESCKARIIREGKLPWREAVQIALQVARGLRAAAREGIIHRDIKPENVLVDTQGRVRIADLGLAKEQGRVEPMPSDTSLGTPDYMSPEQVNNSETVDLRSDIYSLGASLFHMICGKAPYTGRSAYEVMVKHVNAELPSPHKYAPDLPREVADVMRKMMAQDPEDRYQTYEDLLEDLSALLAGAPVAAREFDRESLLGQNGLAKASSLYAGANRLLWVAVPVLAAVGGAVAYLLLSD
ncbi:MAG: serine/threonine-protein kinase [Candidatus Brocadiia bacterium]